MHGAAYYCDWDERCMGSMKKGEPMETIQAAQRSNGANGNGANGNGSNGHVPAGCPSGKKATAASVHRVIRRRTKALCVHAKHASSVQSVQNKTETIRTVARGSSSSTMTMKEQAFAEIKAAWKKIEKHNLEFGKVCCEWRDKFKAPGFRKEGDGVSPILDELSIPKSTAYYWMNRYEISIGAKAAKPEKPEPDAPSTWAAADEKRANRSDPIAGIEGYKILATKMLEAGYRALLATKAADESHLWAAKDWAKLRLDLGGAL